MFSGILISKRRKGWRHTEKYKSYMSESRRGKKNPAWKGGTSQLPEVKAKYARKWRKLNESYVRDREYKKRFGVSLEEYDKMLLIQNGLCAICGNTCKRGRLSIDHSHKTGIVRGLLCRKCNVILGLISDNLNWLNKALDYLKKYKNSK